IVAVIRNPQKAASLFSLAERESMLVEVTGHLGNVQIEFFAGLLVDFARIHGADTIDTFFLATSPQYSFLSSSLVREVARFGGDVSSLVPPVVAARLDQRFKEGPPA